MEKTWTKEKLADWKRFWETEMGVIALDKFKQLKEQYIEYALRAKVQDEMNYYVGRAAGIEALLEDINAGIIAADKEEDNSSL